MVSGAVLLTLARSTQVGVGGHSPAVKGLLLLLFPFLPLGGRLSWSSSCPSNPFSSRKPPEQGVGIEVNGAELPQGQINRQMTPGKVRWPELGGGGVT